MPREQGRARCWKIGACPPHSEAGSLWRWSGKGEWTGTLTYCSRRRRFGPGPCRLPDGPMRLWARACCDVGQAEAARISGARAAFFDVRGWGRGDIASSRAR